MSLSAAGHNRVSAATESSRTILPQVYELRSPTIAATRSRVSGTAIAITTKAALASHLTRSRRTLVTRRRDGRP